MKNQTAETPGESEPGSELQPVGSALASRSLFGGALMGLANLVPGISGGTMLLAAGIYPQFIDAIADLTRFRFRWKSLLVLGSVAVAAGIAILLGAGILKELVVDQRWIMFSLFIGLTLGGIPAVWKLAKPGGTSLVVAALIAFAAMVALVILRENGVVGSSGSGLLISFLAGLAGASAMILPGLSGGYILLLMGQYVPILSAIDQFKEALQQGEVSVAMEPMLTILLPVGLGVVAGIVIVGNAVQWMLRTYRQATLGFLLGLLLGSIAGLWPFQQSVAPQPGDMLKGQIVTAENIADFDAEDWDTQVFAPSPGQVVVAALLILVGAATTLAVARLGSDERESGQVSDGGTDGPV